MDGVPEFDRRAVLHVTVRTGGGGRCFAPVVSLHGLTGLVVTHNECAAAYAGGLRLDQGQYHLRRDDGVYGRTAVGQDPGACPRGQGMGADQHVVLCADYMPSYAPARCFGSNIFLEG